MNFALRVVESLWGLRKKKDCQTSGFQGKSAALSSRRQGSQAPKDARRGKMRIKPMCWFGEVPPPPRRD